jgi:hypothetical protein
MSQTQDNDNETLSKSAKRIAPSRLDKGSDQKRIELLEERVTALETVFAQAGLHFPKSPTIVKE